MDIAAFHWSAVVEYVLYAFALYGVMRVFTRFKKSSNKDVNWSAAEAVGVSLAIYYGVQFLLALVLQLFVLAVGWDKQQIESTFNTPSVGVQFAFTLVSYGAMAASIIWFVKRRKTPLKVIGVVAPQFRDIGYALAGFGTYFVIYGMIVTSLVDQILPDLDKGQRQDLGFDYSTVGPELLLIFLSLTILPPLVEELLVRGFMYTGLRTSMTKIRAAIIASLFFGAAHLQGGTGDSLLWTAAIDTFTLSLILIWLRQKTGSLWPGIGVHFIKNGIAFIALFIFKVT